MGGENIGDLKPVKLSMHHHESDADEQCDEELDESNAVEFDRWLEVRWLVLVMIQKELWEVAAFHEHAAGLS